MKINVDCNAFQATTIEGKKKDESYDMIENYLS